MCVAVPDKVIKSAGLLLFARSHAVCGSLWRKVARELYSCRCAAHVTLDANVKQGCYVMT